MESLLARIGLSLREELLEDPPYYRASCGRGPEGFPPKVPLDLRKQLVRAGYGKAHYGGTPVGAAAVPCSDAGPLPPPADADDLLLLCGLFTVRSRLERFARSSPVHHTRVMVDIEDKVEAGISRGTLHPEVLLDWYPLERLAKRLYPPPRQLPDLLRAERLLGVYAANPHPLHMLADALDSGFRADLGILTGPQVLGARHLAAKHDVSRTRIQHIEREAARVVARTFQAEPLPYRREPCDSLP